MKHINITVALSLLAGGVLLAGCEDSYVVTGTGTAASNEAVVSIRNEQGKAYYTNVEVRDDVTEIPLTAKLLGGTSAGADVTLEIGDASLVEAYNATYGTSYEYFPLGDAVLSDATLQFTTGRVDTESNAVATISAASIEPGKVYALPIVSNVKGTGLRAGDPHFILVKDFRSIPDNDKGVVIFNCIESDTNSILDNMGFKLRNTGQQFVDVAVIFTSGGAVSLNLTTGEINMPVNPGTIGHLAYQDKIIGEVHRRGCKVISCITSKGIAQLDVETSKELAKKIADFVYAYNLDGMFFDTEYTTYDTSRPGFESSSTERLARFILEVKRAMPDKMVVCYLYGPLADLRNVSTCDGVALADFVDYGLNDYGASIVPSALPSSQIGILSNNCASYCSLASLDNCARARQYGAHMSYCLTQWRYNSNTGYTRTALDNMASSWFNDSIVIEPLDNVYLDW